jgi:putative membrane protein
MHLTSNVVERWLGLGRVQIQTASGRSGAEMTIEGLPDFELIRDQLYRRMRGARGSTDVVSPADTAGEPAPSVDGRVVEALNEAVSELRAIRELLARKADG